MLFFKVVDTNRT